MDSGYRNAQGRVSADFTAVAVTYAQVAAHPALHRQRTENRRTLVIFDEIHHAGDALSWGEAVRESFEPARRRVGLTGPPLRSDASPIPFVTYVEEPDGARRSSSDYVHGYGPALGDGIVRPVIFLAYSGEMRWRTRAGDEIAATLGAPMTSEQLAQAWRTALDPQGEWVARGIGARPVIVLSDDPSASRKIAAFASSDDRWMVAVRMVSEGVDIPRLAVGVFATSVSTALFFAQAVGRFVRARRRGETASVFLPSVPVLLGYAAELEAERDHVLRRPDDDPERELAEAQRQRDTPDELGEAPFTALEASAHFDRVLYDGGEFGASAEEDDFLGLPGLLEPERVALLLRKRQADQLRKRSGAASAASPASAGAASAASVPVSAGAASAASVPVSGSSPRPARETLAALRKELNGLIAAWHHRTGQPHGVIHAELRRACGGPPPPPAPPAARRGPPRAVRPPASTS